MRRIEDIVTVISVIVFLVLYLGLGWSFIVSLVVSGGVLLASFILLEPVPKIGDTSLLNIKDAARIEELYNTALESIQGFDELAELVNKPEIKESILELSDIAYTIMAYLERYPKKISSVEHFLDYYVETAYKIISRYQEIESLQKQNSKLTRLQDETAESLAYLIYIYNQYYDQLQKQTITELTLENELLEATLQQTAQEISNMRKLEKQKGEAND